MGLLKQKNRFLSITDFSLGGDTFVITSFQGNEFVSDLFEFEIELFSDNVNISPDDVIGKTTTITINNDIGRCFHGYVRAFSLGEMARNDYRHYKITVVPWLWFLTQTQHSRIFQEKNTKDIVSAVFADLGFNDFDFQAEGGSVREYCVQHAESDFEFVSRLLEEEGIAYYFTHSDDKHQMLIVDQPNAYTDVSEAEVEHSQGSHSDSKINQWEHLYQFRKGEWTISDYNFKEPKKNLTTSTKTKSKFANNSKFEHYEYPGMYDTTKGSDIAKIRLESEESLRNSAVGESDCSSFYAGGKFKITKHERDSEQDSYILVQVSHHITEPSYFVGDDGGPEYRNNFLCIPAAVHFRPTPVHKRPLMQGPQSALVVGPAGEEIYIDEFCRIKVQFYWDREGKKDENTTCFIRVVQSWAGNQWGSSFIPRIGHEVIVNFLDGDPDRPLVTGSVYNGWNKPVYSSKTQSGIKTRSTKGGNSQNFNELRFEDLKGSEQIYIHAEKNMDTQVENDETLTVDNDRTKCIKHDETSIIDNDRTKHVKNDESYTIDNDRSKVIGNNQTEDVAKNNTMTIGDNQTEKVGKNISIDIGENHAETIGKNMTITVDKDLKETVKGGYTESVTKDYSLDAKTITLTAKDQITFKTGSAQIVMKKNGDITISGKNINVKGSGNVVLKGSKVTAN